ncbi:hypothetical protein [Azotobacter beijerinckii]|uniref:Uncharacterized protein n=1 Tax=Azotobacter beijerinckii TaxID=170623 RepID=A0A1I4INU9_9GAMM|nr:hypothetical protein [Azotobacter beijerinckii]MDV7213276.1 hypothetical protein [Azotobacter beijerinckii]SFB63773.1 hypothetical protein SAMN04244571_04581 [Azotobacter beijerinckii]SFL56038.1 hypothetical protein SAMN04244574_04655 [Azotobacter beijerinckii]
MTFDTKRSEFDLLISRAKRYADLGEKDPIQYKEAFETLFEAVNILADSCERDFQKRLAEALDS